MGHCTVYEVVVLSVYVATDLERRLQLEEYGLREEDLARLEAQPADLARLEAQPADLSLGQLHILSRHFEEPSDDTVDVE